MINPWNWIKRIFIRYPRIVTFKSVNPKRKSTGYAIEVRPGEFLVSQLNQKHDLTNTYGSIEYVNKYCVVQNPDDLQLFYKRA